MAATLCALKQRIRWRSAPWKPAYCQRLAETVLEAAVHSNLPPALIVAVMINESSLEERATRTTLRNGVVYAKDGGLMGIRCIPDGQDRCTNGKVRGMPFKEVMNPTTNIRLGAEALAYWRDVGGVLREPVRVRARDGTLVTRHRHRRCPHRDHPYWAHYNHGDRYISTGRARNYPHHIAVLYYALARTMKVETGEMLSVRLGAREPGRQPKRADRPIGPRHRSLCRIIVNLRLTCGDSALVLANPRADEPR